MSEDPLLDDLVRVSREEDAAERSRLDDRWDRLAAGTASAEEVAELRALAEGSGEAAAAYEAFRPLGADFRQQVVRAIREQDARTNAALAAPAPARWSWRFPRLGVWLASGGAAAAVTAVAIRLAVLAPSPLPRYAIAELSGGTATMRAERLSETPVFGPHDRFEAEVQPVTAVAGGEHLETECFLARDREFRRLESTAEVDPRGARRLSGRIDPDVAPGLWRLWVVVARPGKLPAEADLAASLEAGSTHDRGWVATSREIEIRAP